jgi:hypothetical protein
MAKHSLDIETLRRIEQLCVVGARPPTIVSLLPTANPSLIRERWEAAQGYTPPKGRLPMLVEWYFSNYQIKLHASCVASFWRRATENSVHYVDAYLAAYNHYLEIFPEPLLTFDRAWCLIRALSSKQMTTAICPKCDTTYVHNPNDLVNHKTCPCCRVFGLRPIISAEEKQVQADIEQKKTDGRKKSKPIVQVDEALISASEKEEAGKTKNLPKVRPRK